MIGCIRVGFSIDGVPIPIPIDSFARRLIFIRRDGYLSEVLSHRPQIARK